MKKLFLLLLFAVAITKLNAQTAASDRAKAEKAAYANRYKEALPWYEKAAEKGDAKSMSDLADIYYYGKKDIPKNIPKALYWYEKAAQNGNIFAMWFYAQICRYGKDAPKDTKKAIYWYEKAADKGEFDHYGSIGDMYANGEVDGEKNIGEAIKWYQKGIDKKVGNCQIMLDNLWINLFNEATPYYNTQNYQKAFEIYSVAAKYNNKEGIINVADMYEKGLGVEKDVEKAKFWYGKLNSSFGNEKIAAIDKKIADEKAKEEEAEKEKIAKAKAAAEAAEKAKETVAVTTTSTTNNTGGLGIFDYRRNNSNNTLGTGKEKTYLFQSKCNSRGTTINVISEVFADASKHGIDDMKNAAMKTISNNGWQIQSGPQYLGLKENVTIPGKAGRDYVISSASIY